MSATPEARSHSTTICRHSSNRPPSHHPHHSVSFAHGSQVNAQATIESHAQELRQINRWMYDNPEVALQEHQSSAKLSEFLTARASKSSIPAYGLETAFVARTGSTGPEVVICAEYDALPALDRRADTTSSPPRPWERASALKDFADQLGIRVTVLGTPAEELYGGKVDLINAGAFSNAAMAIMVHPSTHDVVDPTVISVAHLDVSFHGKTAHASAFPFLGINALDAFVQAYVNISTLRQQLETTDKVHGIITHGGDAANIIPGFTKSTWYVRAPNQDRLDVLLPRITACFEAAATATGCTLSIERVGHLYEDMRHNPLLVDLYRSQLRRDRSADAARERPSSPHFRLNRYGQRLQGGAFHPPDSSASTACRPATTSPSLPPTPSHRQARRRSSTEP